MLCDRPAVLAWQLRQQTQYERPRPAPRLHAAETPADPGHQLIEYPQPAAGVYAEPAATRRSLPVVTNRDDQTVAAPSPAPTHPRSRSTAGVLGVELACEVFQAAVDLDGDHAVPGAEPAGDAGGGGQVGTGRRPGEDALGAGRLAGGLECPGFGNGHDLVIVARVELGRAVADAAALDVMGPRWPAGQHRRFSRLDHGPVHVRQRGGQRAADAQEAAGGADIAAESADRRRAGKLIEQLLTEAAVAVHHVGVVELVGGERAGLCGDLGCPAHHGWDQAGRDAIGAGYQLDLGAERPHRADLLVRERIG